MKFEKTNEQAAIVAAAIISGVTARDMKNGTWKYWRDFQLAKGKIMADLASGRVTPEKKAKVSVSVGDVLRMVNKGSGLRKPESVSKKEVLQYIVGKFQAGEMSMEEFLDAMESISKK